MVEAAQVDFRFVGMGTFHLRIAKRRRLSLDDGNLVVMPRATSDPNITAARGLYALPTVGRFDRL